MELKELKKLCDVANDMTFSAQENEKRLKIEYIKEYFFSKLKDTRVLESGCNMLDVAEKNIYFGKNNERILGLVYDPQAKRYSSLCGIDIFCIDRKDNGSALEIAIENLPYEDINKLYNGLILL